MEVPQCVPESFCAGDTLQFSLYHSDFLPADGWSMEFAAVILGHQIKLTSTADGDRHKFRVAPASTAGYTAGNYSWKTTFVSTADRIPSDSGVISVQANISGATSGLDNRSALQKAVDAIETYISDPTGTNLLIAQQNGPQFGLRRENALEKLAEARHMLRLEIDRQHVRNGGRSRRIIHTRAAQFPSSYFGRSPI